MSSWWRHPASYGWVGALAGIAAVIVTVVLSQPSTDDEESNGNRTRKTVGQEPPGPGGAEPSEPARIPVRWHGSILLSVDASDVTTERFDEADFDADPVLPAEDGDIRIDYGGTLEISDGKAFGVWSSTDPPSREACLQATASHPVTEVELSEGSYACVLSEQDRPARIEVTQGWTEDDDSSKGSIELLVTTWER